MISTFVLDEPRVEGDAVRFSWSVDPPTPLLRGDGFALTFPPETGLASVPPGLLWLAAFAVLHPIWILLRPVRVRFPVRVDPAVAECWLRLIDAAVETLEGMRGTRFLERSVFFAFAGLPLPQPVPAPDRGRTASSFSGGKDSLLQASLLRELDLAPLLVTVTSELPPLKDHVTPRRARMLRDAPLTLGLPAAEVRTEARSLWENGFAGRLGYGLAVSELTDTHLYFAALVIAGAAAGATHLFVASEADVQTMEASGETLVQNPHFMYSVATLAALAALLAPYGMTVSSLTSPLFNAQVQRLLWTRYPDAAIFQYSCWRVEGDGAPCNACSQCLRVVLGILAAGDDPARAGFDADAVMATAATWVPKWIPTDGPRRSDATSRAHLSAQMIATVRGIDDDVARKHLGDAGYAAFVAFRERLSREASNAIGMRPSFAAFLDPLVRDRVMDVYAAAFPGAASEDDAEAFARSRSLADRIVAGGSC